MRTDPVRRANALPKNAGLTLVEVLTAVSLLGIVTAVAATNFTAMAPAFRTRGAALAIAGDLNQARMASIKEARVYEYFPISGGYQIRRDDGMGGREVVKQVVIGNEYPHVTSARTRSATTSIRTAPTFPAPTRARRSRSTPMARCRTQRGCSSPRRPATRRSSRRSR
jgi:prepilin-type N-terminal cleavage/methylation domain-containing protein